MLFGGWTYQLNNLTWNVREFPSMTSVTAQPHHLASIRIKRLNFFGIISPGILQRDSLVPLMVVVLVCGIPTFSATAHSDSWPSARAALAPPRHTALWASEDVSFSEVKLITWLCGQPLFTH